MYVPEAVADKLMYYVGTAKSSTDADIGSLRMVFLLAVPSVVSLLASGLRPDPRTRPWLAVPWLTAAVHYLSVADPAGLASHDADGAFGGSGFIVWQMFAGQRAELLLPVLNVLLLYKVAAFASGSRGPICGPACSCCPASSLGHGSPAGTRALARRRAFPG